jgi:hypothetical protein
LPRAAPGGLSHSTVLLHRAGDLRTAYDAPLEMPDRSRAGPLHLRAAGAQAGAARARDGRPARGEGAEA